MANDLDDLDGAEGDPQSPHRPRADHQGRPAKRSALP